MIRNYKDLKVWQKARKLVREVYFITNKLPKSELFALTSQMRRSVVSIPSNIAEGHARNTTKEYINFLYIAYGSLAELETQIILACDIGYFKEEEVLGIVNKIHEVQKMLTGLRKSLNPKT